MRTISLNPWQKPGRPGRLWILIGWEKFQRISRSSERKILYRRTKTWRLITGSHYRLRWSRLREATARRARKISLRRFLAVVSALQKRRVISTIMLGFLGQFWRRHHRMKSLFGRSE